MSNYTLPSFPQLSRQYQCNANKISCLTTPFTHYPFHKFHQMIVRSSFQSQKGQYLPDKIVTRLPSHETVLPKESQCHLQENGAYLDHLNFCQRPSSHRLLPKWANPCYYLLLGVVLFVRRIMSQKQPSKDFCRLTDYGINPFQTFPRFLHSFSCQLLAVHKDTLLKYCKLLREKIKERSVIPLATSISMRLYRHTVLWFAYHHVIVTTDTTQKLN